MTSSDPNQDPVQPSLTEGAQLPMVAQNAGPPAVPPTTAMSAWTSPGADDGVNLVEYLHSLRRRWLLGLTVGCLLAVLTAGLLWFVVPETYEAASLLHVKRNRILRMNTNDRATRVDDREYISFKNTQIALITSWHVLAPAIDTPGIGRLPMLQGERDRVAYLASVLRVSYPDDAEVLRISLRGENPMECADIVDAVTDSYVDNVVSTINARENDRLDYLRRKLIEMQRQISTDTATLHELKVRNGYVDTDSARLMLDKIKTDLSQLQRQRDDFQRQSSELRSQIISWQRRLQNPYEPGRTEIEMILRGNERYQMALAEYNQAKDAYDAALGRSATGQDQFVARAAQSLQAAEIKKQRLYNELAPEARDQILLQRGYDPNLVQTTIYELQGQYATLQAQYQTIEQLITEKETELSEMVGFSVDVEVKQAELDQLIATADTIKKETDILAMNVESEPRIELLQPARPEEQSDIMFKYVTVFGAAFVVLVLTMVGFTLGDYLGKRVNSDTDVAKNAHIPVMGTLPIVHGGWMSHLWPFGKKSLDFKLQESIDSIRTAIIYNRRPKPVRVVMVTSATSQEGKTTVASQLAVSLARAGRRTLLIDGDFHNPQQHEVFGVVNNIGFSDVLRGEVDGSEAVIATEAEGLWLMTAGYCDRAALQALASPAGREKVEQLQSQFDYIILDAAPVLTGAEALLLGQLSDSALLSIRRDVSRTPKITAACQRLESVGIDLLGGILNGAPGEIRDHSMFEYDEEAEAEEALEAVAVADDDEEHYSGDLT